MSCDDEGNAKKQKASISTNRTRAVTKLLKEY